MSSFGVHRSVVREALSLLADVGLLERKRGSGTSGMAVSPTVRIEHTAAGFSTSLASASLAVEVMSWRHHETAPPLVDILTPSSSPGFLSVELRSWSFGTPLAFGSHFVRAPECDLLDRTGAELNWRAFLERSGVALGEPDGYTLRAEAADAADSEVLGVALGSPLLSATGQIRDAAGEVISFFTSRSRTAYAVAPSQS